MLNKIQAVLLLCLIPAFVYAQQGSEVVKKLQNKFKSINTLSADFVQTGSLSQDKKLSTVKGRLYFQKENKYRIEYGSLEFISDGSTVWNYNKRNNKVIINDLNTSDASTFSLKNLVYDYPQNSTIEALPSEVLNGVKCDVTLLNSKGGKLNFKSVKIFSDESGLIRKAEITDKSGTVYAFELSNIKVNPQLKTGLFSFETPKGSEVIDLR